MDQLLKNLPGFQTKVTSLLIFTENSMGLSGVIRGEVRDGRVSQLLPVSPAYLRKRIDFLEENEKVKFSETIRILPPGVMFYNQYGHSAGIVMTMPPCKKRLFISTPTGKKAVTYHFPHLLVCYASESLHLAYAYEPITEKTILYEPRLPNFPGGTGACFGTVKHPDIRALSLPKLIIAVWEVVFNGLYTGHSGQEVFSELLAHKTVSKYADISHAGRPVGKMKRFINSAINSREIDLFREW